MLLKRSLLNWLPIAVAVTGISFVIYATVQQGYRSSLNDPQIQLAQDGAEALKNGALPAEIVPRQALVDAGISLAPFVVVYDEKGLPLESTAFINGYPPKPPAGVFEYVRNYGEDRVTWQPDSNTRIAIVMRHIDREKGGFVLAGRNMREVEARIRSLEMMTCIGWLGVLFATLLTQLFIEYLRGKKD